MYIYIHIFVLVLLSAHIERFKSLPYIQFFVVMQTSCRFSQIPQAPLTYPTPYPPTTQHTKVLQKKIEHEIDAYCFHNSNIVLPLKNYSQKNCFTNFELNLFGNRNKNVPSDYDFHSTRPLGQAESWY